jgi:hypothetical protein
MHSDGADGYGNGAGRLSMTRNLSMTGNNVSEWLYMLEDYAQSIQDIAMLKDTVSPSAIPDFTPNLPFIADKDEDFLPGSLAIRSFIAQRVTWKKLHMYELDKHDKEKAEWTQWHRANTKLRENIFAIVSKHVIDKDTEGSTTNLTASKVPAFVLDHYNPDRVQAFDDFHATRADKYTSITVSTVAFTNTLKWTKEKGFSAVPFENILLFLLPLESVLRQYCCYPRKDITRDGMISELQFTTNIYAEEFKTVVAATGGNTEHWKGEKPREMVSAGVDCRGRVFWKAS